MTKQLEEVYRLDRSDATRRIALRLIVDCLDDWLNEGRFDKCNAMLLAAEPDQLSESAVVTFLGITKTARDNPLMFGREIFYRRAHAVVKDKRGSEDAANKLLDKYL